MVRAAADPYHHRAATVSGVAYAVSIGPAQAMPILRHLLPAEARVLSQSKRPARALSAFR